MAYHETISIVQQQKNSYITIRLNKYDDIQLQTLLNSLASHEAKIADFHFNPENRNLTIYYTSAITLDDIFALVLEHITDFDKVSGTEL